MTNSHLTYTSKEIDGALVFSFIGDLDKQALEDNKLTINEAINVYPGKNVVFDFNELNYINSESIGYLMQINGYLLSIDKKFILVGIKANIKDILDAIGISEIIEVYPSINDIVKN